jgi:hypothetical protein
LLVTNTPAYYVRISIEAVQSFIGSANLEERF